MPVKSIAKGEWSHLQVGPDIEFDVLINGTGPVYWGWTVNSADVELLRRRLERGIKPLEQLPTISRDELRTLMQHLRDAGLVLHKSNVPQELRDLVPGKRIPRRLYQEVYGAAKPGPKGPRKPVG